LYPEIMIFLHLPSDILSGHRVTGFTGLNAQS
jgi:hypothetical protein